MGRAALTPDDHAAFRAAMRDVATRRFARLGEAGVTMRGLADDLGCSAMTPYRYFRDKDEIFAMVRLAAIEAFADAQERAFATESDPVQRLHALGRAYVAHALAQPDQYRVMFQLERRGDRKAAEPVEPALRGWLLLRNTIAEAVEAGALRGDADEIAHVLWSALHGLVALHLAGKLRLGRDLDSLVRPTIDLLLAGARAARDLQKENTMTKVEQFLAYAAAFEKTYVDDDWRRLERFFTEDATYRVSGLPREYELRGRDNILRGMRKSVDGFDRKMALREIVPTAPVVEADGRVTFEGFVRYQRADSPPVELRATLVAEFDGDRICNMHDTFKVDAAGLKWLGRYARDLDGSYV